MTSRIVVGVDGSESARRAVRWAAREARDRRARLELVSAWHLPSYGESLAAVMSAEDLMKELIRDAEDLLGEARDAARVEAPDVPIETHAIEGQPATVLMEAAEGASLLVLGSRGLGGFRGLLLGSVSTECAHRARCPVVIVPHDVSAVA
jgi:nucleotide-binding universal stress UspA family protein